MSIYLANSLLSNMPLGAFNQAVYIANPGTTVNLAQAPAATAVTTATFYGS